MNNFLLEGKHILIVGASSGIGSELAKLCFKKGAMLTLTSRDINKLKDDLGLTKNVKYLELDVADEGQMKVIVEGLENVDGVVYLPGIVKLYPAQFINKKHIDLVRIPIFDGAVYLISSLLRAKKINNNSSLVFTSSISSSYPYKGGAIYTSSKAALETYSKTLSIELASKKIRSNCVKAGLVETKIMEDTRENVEKEIYDYHIKKYPLGVGEPIDVANAIFFLLSSASKWITGTEITLDGGLTAGA
jgi:predicted outer membrane repeat protein